MTIFLLLVLIIGIVCFLLFTEAGKSLLKQLQDYNAAKALKMKEARDNWQNKIYQLEDSRDPQTARSLLEDLKKLFQELDLRPTLLGKSGIIERQDIQKAIQLIASICIRETDVIDDITSQMKKYKYMGFMSRSKLEPYHLALRVLDEHPTEPRAKQFVLEVGRWNFGALRKGNAATTYDEQAIANDIKVRERV
jgi:hypothetical protein